MKQIEMDFHQRSKFASSHIRHVGCNLINTAQLIRDWLQTYTNDNTKLKMISRKTYYVDITFSDNVPRILTTTARIE